ncbi:MAG: hypothetical protein AABX82_03570 [Nanoarchaeota archaeon]
MERKKCEECHGKIVKRNVDYIFLGENLGKFPAEVCTSCGEAVFEEDVTKKISLIAKQKGLWGLNDRARVNQIGGSVGITINKKIAEFLALKKGEEVILYPENKKRLIIQIP